MKTKVSELLAYLKTFTEDTIVEVGIECQDDCGSGWMEFADLDIGSIETYVINGYPVIRLNGDYN